MSFKSEKEKKAFRAGVISQCRKCVHKTSSVSPRYLGSTFVNGKFYDTNFKKPVEISKSLIKQLHEQYDVYGNSTDKEVVDRYVMHMRRKFGVFDRRGNFLYMLGDK